MYNVDIEFFFSHCKWHISHFVFLLWHQLMYFTLSASSLIFWIVVFCVVTKVSNRCCCDFSRALYFNVLILLIYVLFNMDLVSQSIFKLRKALGALSWHLIWTVILSIFTHIQPSQRISWQKFFKWNPWNVALICRDDIVHRG